MAELTVKWTGIRPMVMHSAEMIDPDSPHVRAKNELGRQKKKLKKDDFVGIEKIRRQIERAEWEGSLYWNKEDGLFCPGDNIMACIVEGAKKTKCGKQAQQAIVPIDNAPIKTKRNTTDLEELFADPEFQLRKPVRIPPKTGSRVMAVRPMVPRYWEIKFTVEYDESTLPKADLIEAMETAGKLIGIGDWRPVFGRFTVEVL